MYKAEDFRYEKKTWHYVIIGPGIYIRCRSKDNKKELMRKIDKTLDRLNGGSQRWSSADSRIKKLS